MPRSSARSTEPRSPRGDLSPSRLRLYDQCPRAYEFRHVRREPERDPEGWWAVGTAVHAALESAGRDHLAGRPVAPLPDYVPGRLPPPVARQAAEILRDLTVGWGGLLAVEEPWEVRLASGTAVGVMDRVERGTDGAVCAVDYKTGENVLARDEAEDDPQVGLYLVALREREPFGPAPRMTLWYLTRDVHVTVPWTPALDARWRAHADARIREWREAREFPPRVGPHCARCAWRRLCPAYATLLDAAPLQERPSGAATLAQLADYRQRMAGIAEVAEAARKEVDAVLRARLQADGVDVASDDGWEVARVARTTYEPATAAEAALVLGREGVILDPARYARVDVARLDAALVAVNVAPDARRRIMADLRDLREPRDAYEYTRVRRVGAAPAIETEAQR